MALTILSIFFSVFFFSGLFSFPYIFPKNLLGFLLDVGSIYQFEENQHPKTILTFNL